MVMEAKKKKKERAKRSQLELTFPHYEGRTATAELHFKANDTTGWYLA